MVDLFAAPFVDLIDRMRLEFQQRQSMFDLPARRWYVPSTDPDAPDLSVRFHDQKAGTPVGPASGPQTQMAQNLVLSWLGGARILELKTVQVDDQLTIGRPCIDAPNVGYNIEFSQELRVPDSLDQYVQGAMLIHMLRAAPAEFGFPFGDADLAGPAGDTIFDMSVGYDLEGVRTDKVRRFIEGMLDASPSVERLRGQIPHRLRALRDLDYPTRLSRTITLSTFHGCPAEEIERIAEFLLVEMGVHVIVKMNPPMLGQQRLEHLLHDVMEYHELKVVPTAYSNGLQFDESIAMCRRLLDVASRRGLQFGAKFTNTLEVVNHRSVFPADEKVMYLSGAPLHVLALTLAEQFRLAMGREIPISFSAGVDRKNFPNLVACGFCPVTTCTDLLKTGGYGRLAPYLQGLAKEMKSFGVGTVDEYILAARNQHAAAAGDPACAARLNSAIIVEETQRDRRYAAEKNRSTPRRLDSRLTLFDCLTCDKCVPVCPNDANFLYETQAVDHAYRDVEVAPNGEVREIGDELRFAVARAEQIANFADFCNHCGNCDTFCPEWDGPYLMKPSFFGSRASFEAAAPHDGFMLERSAGRPTLHGRIHGEACRLDQMGHDPCHAPAGTYRYDDGVVTLDLLDGAAGLTPDTPAPAEPHRVDLGRFFTLALLLEAMTNNDRVMQVNVAQIADESP